MQAQAKIIILMVVCLVLVMAGVVLTGTKKSAKTDFLIGNQVFKNSKDVQQKHPTKPSYKTGEVIVKLKPLAATQVAKNLSSPTATGISSLDNLNQQYQVQSIESLFDANSAGLSAGLNQYFKIKYAKKTDPQAVSDAYQKDSNIQASEPNLVMSSQMSANDPYYNSHGSWGQNYEDLYGIKNIKSGAAWDLSTGANTIVAVIDTGIDYNHEDLAANVWVNTGEIPGNGIDDDHDGYIDDYYGYNFASNNGNPLDDNGHGTHCAGTIAGVTNNGKGVTGVAGGAKIMGLKFLDASGNGYEDDAARAIYYAVAHGAKVLNNSWGGWGYSQLLQDAINYAWAHNVLFVAAAGNSNYDATNFSPAGLDHVMTVAAVDNNDQKASFSNYGNKVEVSAPGVDILSLRAAGTDMYGDGSHIVGSKYYRASGTSMAAPHVSGEAALVAGAYSGQSIQDFFDLITASTDPINSSQYIGTGRINALKAVKPIIHPDGSLVKTANDPKVFVLDSGNKRHIPNPAVFDSNYKWLDVTIITSYEMNRYPDGAEMTAREGALIKGPDPSIYVYTNGTKRHIASIESFGAMGYNPSSVIGVPAETVDAIANGADIISENHVDGSLLYSLGNPAVYLIGNGQKHHIVSAPAFESRFRWQDIAIASQAEIDSLTTSTDLMFRNSSLVKDFNSPAIYAIDNGAKRHIASMETFIAMGYNINQVSFINSDELNLYPDGADL